VPAAHDRPLASLDNRGEVREPTLLDRIQSLIAAPLASDGGPSVDHVENVLTEGYAAALALEAERWRLERRLGVVAASLSEGDHEGPAEIASIATRISATGEELLRLRDALAVLHERVSEERAAA
jgi:hypothetical protein